MADELVDVVDRNHVPIGQILKSVVHKLGLWHYSMHCWIYRVDPETENTYLLFQERAASKAFYPNCLDASVGGHLAAGETRDDALREIPEEIGIEVDRNKLQYLGLRTEVTSFGEIDHKEFCNVFLLETDKKPTDMALQVDEVSAVVEIPVTEGLALFAGEIFELTVQGANYMDGKLQPYSKTISTKDFLFRHDPYYQKMFLFTSIASTNPALAKYLAI